MSCVQADIQKLCRLNQADPMGEELGSFLWNVRHYLCDSAYAKVFVQQEGLTIILQLLKSGHEVIKLEAIRCFLCLMCHYAVISTLLNEDYLDGDIELFTSLISSTDRCNDFGYGEVDPVKSSINILTFLIHMMPNGFQMFCQAAESFSATRDPYQNFSKVIADGQVGQESLRLVQTILRNSISTNTSETVQRLLNGGLEGKLMSLKKGDIPNNHLSDADMYIIEEILSLLKNPRNRVEWFMQTVKRRSVRYLIVDLIRGMNYRMSQHTIRKIMDEKFDEMEDRLIVAQENMEKEFSRLGSTFRRRGHVSTTKTTTINSTSTTSTTTTTTTLSTSTTTTTTTTLSTATTTSITPSTTGTATTTVTSITRAIPTSSTTTPIGIKLRPEEIEMLRVSLDQKCTSIFLETIKDYLKTLFLALEMESGASIKLEELNQCIDLSGLERKGSDASHVPPFRRGNNSESKEGRCYFLLDVVSELTSQTLALRYHAALSDLSLSDVQKVAEYAFWKITEGLRKTKCQLSCNEILKCITRKPEVSILELAALVDGKCLEISCLSSLYVIHPKFGRISPDEFLKKFQYIHPSPPKESISKISVPSIISSSVGSDKKSGKASAEKKSGEAVAKTKLSQVEADALERINQIDSLLLDIQVNIPDIDKNLENTKAEISEIQSLLPMEKTN